jgi:hypothetical protein
VKTTVEIPNPLFHRARKHCAEKGIPFRVLIEDALHRVLDPPAHPQPFRLRPFGFRGEGISGPTEWSEIREMIYEGRGGHVDRG